MSLSRYLGSFNVNPSKVFIERVDSKKDLFLQSNNIMLCPNFDSMLLMGWAWLYCRDFATIYRHLDVNEYVTAKLNRLDSFDNLHTNVLQHGHLIMLGLDSQDPNNYTEKFIPSLYNQRSLIPDAETLFLVEQGASWMIPQGRKFHTVGGAVSRQPASEGLGRPVVGDSSIGGDSLR